VTPWDGALEILTAGIRISTPTSRSPPDDGQQETEQWLN
jgi:hypothetical protein